MIKLAIVIVLLMAFLFLVQMAIVVIVLVYGAYECWKWAREERLEQFQSVIGSDDRRPPAFALTRWIWRKALAFAFRSA